MVLGHGGSPRHRFNDGEDASFTPAKQLYFVVVLPHGTVVEVEKGMGSS
jgi:hypothetical protein